MLRFRRNILIIMLAVLMSACSSEPRPPVETERAVLVYMVAANTLGTDVVSGGVSYPRVDMEDIGEMTRAAGALGSSARLLVFRDCYEGSPALYEVTESGLSLLKEYDRSESCLAVGRMRRVIADARQIAPAKHFGLVLWSHASGWLNDGTPDSAEAAPAKRRTFGQDRNRRMNIPDLAAALDGQDLEFIYFDCCLMASVEVAYELRRCAPYIVASTSELPRPGTPYDLCLPHLVEAVPDGLVKSAEATFRYYVAHPDPEFRTCTISVIDTGALDDLAAATAAIYKGAPLPHRAADVTNYNASLRQGYWLDFGEYAESLATVPGRTPQQAERLAEDFNRALDRAVIYEAATPKIWNRYPVYRHSGLSTYVFNSPEGFTAKGYDGLAWASDVVIHHLN